MKKRKSYHILKMTVLATIPLAFILLFSVSCSGRNKEAKEATEENAVATTKSVQEIQEEPVSTNILYIGVNNPLKIEVAGYEASDLEVLIDNGKISGDNDEYIANPLVPGIAILTIKSKGEEIETREYKVETVSDPVAKIGGKTGGDIDTDFLLEQDKVIAEIENFTLDIEFRITTFTVSVTKDGHNIEEKSGSDLITARQKELIKNQDAGQIILFNNIQCMGPDGATRNLNPIEFILQ